MDSGGVLGKVVFVILALVALYYLYQYLFGPSGLEGKVVLDGINPANPSTAYTTSIDNLPAIYEGGEYSVNTWIYINDYSVNRGMNKCVLTLGGRTFLTLAVYLGAYKNTLNVRVHTKNNTPGSITPAGNAPSPTSGIANDLSTAALNSMFGNMQSDGSLLTNLQPCDIPSVDMQKWVQVTVCLNNKTCDVYLDGKLARSCVLSSFFKVDRTNLALNIADYSGFGGYVSNVSAYNYSLNPEQVWQLYMSGPGKNYTLMGYLTAMFTPSFSVGYPKQNINPLMV
jgi:hypothetical protein